MAEKPTAAFVLSLIGGIFVILGALLWISIGAFLSFLSLGIGLNTTMMGVLGLIFGLIVIVGGVMMYTKPQQHVMWGAIVLILAIVSIPFSFAGLLIGFILALIGGILGLVFKPAPAVPAAAYAPPPMAPPPQ